MGKYRGVPKNVANTIKEKYQGVPKKGCLNSQGIIPRGSKNVADTVNKNYKGLLTEHYDIRFEFIWS